MKKYKFFVMKIIADFLVNNWKQVTPALFVLFSILIPLSYLHHIDSNYLFHDSLSLIKTWMDAFVLFVFIFSIVLVVPLLFGTFYFFILKKHYKNIKNNYILEKYNNLFGVAPAVAILFIVTVYFFDYSNLQLAIIFLIMIASPSILCVFYLLREVRGNCISFLNIIIWSGMLAFLLLGSKNNNEQALSNIFIILLIAYFYFRCIFSLMGNYKSEEKAILEVLKLKSFKSNLQVAGFLALFNFLFLTLYFMLVLSILPGKEILSSRFDDSVRSFNQIIYSILLILIYIISGFRHNYYIKNEMKFNLREYLKESVLIILSASCILLVVVGFSPQYPIFLINPMRGFGYIEDKRDARWYSIDNRFMEWNSFDENFLDKKMLYTKKQMCSKEDFNSVRTMNQTTGKASYHLYGYMAWNVGSIKIFCPVSIPIGKDVGSKCWHIPSQYINLKPE